jgi:hypothetical protein
MPGHFPSPYPDELLYSVCARFSTRAGYLGVKAVLEELLGTATAAAVIDLPNRLHCLAAALPANSSLTIDRLIDQHTLLPFFSAFQTASRVKQLRDDLKGSCGPAGHMRSGIMASRIPMPKHLRFCPECKREDERCFGETYWHRLHQLPGIEVCSLHQMFLENSSVSLHAGRKQLHFISAKDATRSMLARHVDTENRDQRTLLQIARDAEWILEHPILVPNLKALHIRYLSLLIKRESATYTGSIHVKKLLDDFSSYYSPALLRLLTCEITGSDIKKTNWLLRLVRPAKNAHHLLYHLLLIQFLGCNVEKFFQLPEALSLFGEDPWPCLNPAAEHYGQPVIKECQLGNRLRYGKPTGKFSCACGFSYARIGPDSSAENRFHIGRMISFGQVWEAKLKELWKDSSLSLSEVGRRLRVDPLTVRRHASRLKLSFSRSDRSFKLLNRVTQLKSKHNSTALERKQHTYRAKWLSVMKQNRKATLKTLRQKFPQVYAWLRQNDFDWLKGHRPRSQMHIQSTSSVDWKRRDAMYAVTVRVAALRLKNSSGRPMRMTKTAIGRAVSATTLLQQKLHKMPLTAQVLASVVETRIEYAIRRIWRVVKLYCEEKLVPQMWQLIQRANVYRLRKVAEIKEAVEAGIQQLKSALHSNESMQTAS